MARPSAIVMTLAILLAASPHAFASIEWTRKTDLMKTFNFVVPFQKWMDDIGVTAMVGTFMGVEAGQASMSIVSAHMQWESQKSNQPALFEYGRTFTAWPFEGRVRLKGEVGSCKDTAKSLSCTHMSAVRCWRDGAGALACSAVAQGAMFENRTSLREAVSLDGIALATNTEDWQEVSYWRAAPLLKTSIRNSRLTKVNHYTKFVASEPLSPCSNRPLLVPHVATAAVSVQVLRCANIFGDPTYNYWDVTSSPIYGSNSCNSANITIRRVDMNNVDVMVGGIHCLDHRSGYCSNFAALFGLSDGAIALAPEGFALTEPEFSVFMAYVYFLGCVNSEYCSERRPFSAVYNDCKDRAIDWANSTLGLTATMESQTTNAPLFCHDLRDWVTPSPATIHLGRIDYSLRMETGYNDRPLDYGNTSEWKDFYKLDDGTDRRSFWKPVQAACALDDADNANLRAQFILQSIENSYIVTLSGILQEKLLSRQLSLFIAFTGLVAVIYTGLTTNPASVVWRITCGCARCHPIVSSAINLVLYLIAVAAGLFSMKQASESFKWNGVTDVPENKVENFALGRRYAFMYYDVVVETRVPLWTFVVACIFPFVILLGLLYRAWTQEEYKERRECDIERRGKTKNMVAV